MLEEVNAGAEWVRDNSYTLEEFLLGRECEHTYHVMLNKFVPCVVGRGLYKKRLSSRPRHEARLFTASDEAFLLLVLENAWDRWVDIYETDAPGRQGEGWGSSKKARRWQHLSDEKTLYTSGGIRYSETVSIRKTNGWTPEGIDRYNELFRIVKRDREKRPGLFRSWVDSVFANGNDHVGALDKSLLGGGRVVRPIESDLFAELGLATRDDPQIPMAVGAGSQSRSREEWEDAMCDSEDDEP